MREKLRYVWDHLESFLVIALFAVILLTVFVQIVSRIVFSNPLIFTEELARYVYLWMVFLGFSRVTRNDTNIRLIFISQKITGWKQNAFQILIGLFSICAFAYIGYWSIEFADFQWINLAPAMQMSMGIVYLVLPISMALCIIRSVERIVGDIKALKQIVAGDSQVESNGASS